ncbi:MAG: LacI family DNA-binding transcriptional regulator [Pseudomonadota bacterium]
MTHRFPIKEIARQAGVGLATVDRVLNARANVSPQTRKRVAAAIAELEGQEGQLTAKGRQLFVDIIVEAPTRFSSHIQRAAQAVLPNLAMAVFRPRFTLEDMMDADDVAQTLERVRRRGSHGVCLKARDLPQVRSGVAALEAAGIPVVTLVTDLPGTPRRAYVGLDNANAGRTAAFLIAMATKGSKGAILTCRSQDAFYGEAERFEAFCEALKTAAPDLEVFDVSGGAGIGVQTHRRTEAMLEKHNPDVQAVYSMGGGNKAILAALEDRGVRGLPFVAHDLDAENAHLLETGQISFVLHHDLEADMRAAFQTIALSHGMGLPSVAPTLSDIEIITPFNRPRRQAVR